jgi:hypothetical protein
MKVSFGFFFVSTVVICTLCLFFLTEILFLLNGYNPWEMQAYNKISHICFGRYAPIN